ncbi:GyrI-like domain-containing protein [Demequina muriae]|uniref:GyrI-like domain-containing protein n=1 Tax=Demequina muriae TaxID=3051664 RepID=A0ABT8GGV2_9MICO|nr:GyrI-like domain-containing protein [Demequina sp. EGI L300058]MDN4480662.1 GyrI-like domain-containing protein [Demequina sp. EGI L300058]
MKVDLKKELAGYRATRGRIDLIDVPPARYLAMDADGGPEAEAFGAAIASLYPFAYALKFASKRDLGRDYVVPPLEAWWWADDMASFTTARDASQWRSTVLLMIPEWVPNELVDAARESVSAKVPPAHLAQVRVELIDEGRCAQTLHVGPFADEGPVIETLHEAIAAAGLVLAGRHHEIYLSDLRRTPAERLRTILRQPTSPAATAASETR